MPSTLEKKGILATTLGHCFLCDKNLETNGIQGSVTSLQYIFHYVGLDLQKVFSRPEDIVFKKTLEGSGPLKVLLCPLCSGLIQQFSELYRILENVQMELDHCLGLVGETLMKSKPRKKKKVTNNNIEAHNHNPSKGSLMAQMVKTEIVKKCRICFNKKWENVSMFSREFSHDL